MANMSVSPNQSTYPVNYTPASGPVAPPQETSKPNASFPQPNMSIAPADNTYVHTAQGHSAENVSFVDADHSEGHAEATHTEGHDEDHKPSPEGVLAKHSAAMAFEHGVHHAAHKVMHRAGSKALSHGATRAAEHAAGRAAEHAVGHVAARGFASIGARAVPAVGAVVAGGLAVMSAHHSYEAAKDGEIGAAVAYGAAAAVDGVVAGVNAVGAATGVGTVLSTPISLALGAGATGLAALGAWLESD